MVTSSQVRKHVLHIPCLFGDKNVLVQFQGVGKLILNSGKHGCQDWEMAHALFMSCVGNNQGGDPGSIFETCPSQPGVMAPAGTLLFMDISIPIDPP